LERRTAVITGAGTGVGAAIALALAATGADICLIGRRPAALEKVARRVRRLGAGATCYQADLSSEPELLELTRRLARDLPHVDILVQNAAIYVAGAVESARVDDLDRQYRTNVRAPYVLTQALMPLLKLCRGQVVFVNSSSGIGAKPLSAQYDASKHALRALADSLRGEVNKDGIRVLSIYLGRTATEMQARIHEAEGKPYRPDLLLQPEDVASVIVNTLNLPFTAEVTDIHIRSMIPPQPRTPRA
jgi:NADP-dependent 3-hydroxy acid dehydrogenase YdfG